MILNSIYNQKITILNKLKKTDGTTGLDTWHKTVITDAAWYSQTERTATVSSVYIGSYIKVLIPFHDAYLDYSDWKQVGMQDANYTMSVGDYIVLGTVSEDITASNVIATTAKYEPNVCLVKTFQPLHNRFDAYVQLEIEGV